MSNSDYKRWQCVLCAFIYDEAAGMPDEGIAPGTRWADVPETWTCPDCSASKADFDQWGRIAREVAKNGLPLNQHATLTGSIDGILEQIEAIDKDYPVRNLRWSLIHLDQLIYSGPEAATARSTGRSSVGRGRRSGSSCSCSSRP